MAINSRHYTTPDKVENIRHIDSLINEINIDSCFVGIDTSNHLPTIGCVNKFYSLLDNETVLSTTIPKPDSFLGCERMVIDTPGYNGIVLFQYENGRAHLGNVCSCIIYEEAPEPIKTYRLKSAEMLIIGIPSPDSFWNDIPYKSIVFEKTLFEAEDGDQRVIQNKMFLNVADIGPTGQSKTPP